MNINKKTIIVISTVISLVILTSLSFFLFKNNFSNMLPQETKQADLRAEKVIETNVDTETVEKINCGNVVASHSASQDKALEENKTLECFGNAILNCQSAVVNFTGSGSYRYSVDKKEGEFCFISQEVDNPYKKTTCKFPLVVLENSKPLVKGIESQYFAVIAYSLASHKYKDTKTGETINLECFVN